MRSLLRFTSTIFFSLSLALGVAAVAARQVQAGYVVSCGFNKIDGNCYSNACGFFGLGNCRLINNIDQETGLPLPDTCECKYKN